MEDHSADELHIEVAHAHGPLARLADESEAFLEQVVERLRVVPAGPFTKGIGSSAQLGIVEQFKLSFPSSNALNALLELLVLLAFAYAQCALNNGHSARLPTEGHLSRLRRWESASKRDAGDPICTSLNQRLSRRSERGSGCVDVIYKDAGRR